MKVDDVRTAKLSAHYDLSHKVFDTLTKRVGDMSGLNMKTAEMWQTQNYGIGGHYDGETTISIKSNSYLNILQLITISRSKMRLHFIWERETELQQRFFM